MHEKNDDKLAENGSENGDDLMNDFLTHKGLRWRFVTINGKVGCATGVPGKFDVTMT